MNTELLLSIIVPLYNNEQYIEKCLKSLYEQDIPHEEYEIIVVNDGSKDKSREIVLRMQNEIKNLVLFNQENKGVSAARNLGISLSKGKFLLFIDSDDFVMVNSLGKIIGKADKECYDVLYLNFSVYDKDGRFYGKTDYSYLQDKIFSGLETYQITHEKKEKDPDRSVGILYRRKFLQNNNLFLLNDVPYLEDGHFVGKMLCLADRCAFENSPFYIHLTNPESASNSNLYNTQKARQGFIKSALDLQDFAKERDLTLKQLGLVNHLLSKFVLSSIISSVGSKDVKTVLLLRKQLRQLGFKKLNTVGLISNIRYTKSYNCSFWLFLFYYFLETRVRKLLKKTKGGTDDDISY